MEVIVRNLTGSSASVAAGISETVGSIRRSVQDQWGSTCILRLHLRARALIMLIRSWIIIPASAHCV